MAPSVLVGPRGMVQHPRQLHWPIFLAPCQQSPRGGQYIPLCHRAHDQPQSWRVRRGASVDAPASARGGRAGATARTRLTKPPRPVRTAPVQPRLKPAPPRPRRLRLRHRRPALQRCKRNPAWQLLPHAAPWCLGVSAQDSAHRLPPAALRPRPKHRRPTGCGGPSPFPDRRRAAAAAADAQAGRAAAPRPARSG